MFEAYNYSFSNEEKDEMAGILEHETAIKIRNAVSAEYTCMRRSLAPLLLQAIYTNLKQIDSISFFEIAKIHRKDSGGKFEEKKMFGGVFSEMNTKDIRNLLDGLLSRLSIEGAHIESGTNLPFLHPMVSSSYVLDGKTCIRFGKVHPKIAMNFEIPDTTWYFECEYQVLFEKHMSDIASGKQTYVEPNKYPTITRELNFVMDTKQVTNTIGDILYSVDPRIQEVQVIDVFTHAEKVGKDKKSVTFRFSIVDRNKTITDDEALSLQKTCIDSVAKA